MPLSSRGAALVAARVAVHHLPAAPGGGTVPCNERAHQMPKRATWLILPLLPAAGCDSGRDLQVPAAVTVDVPAAPGAALPHVANAGARAILSWVEPAGDGYALR